MTFVFIIYASTPFSARIIRGGDRPGGELGAAADLVRRRTWCGGGLGAAAVMGVLVHHTPPHHRQQQAAYCHTMQLLPINRLAQPSPIDEPATHAHKLSENPRECRFANKIINMSVGPHVKSIEFRMSRKIAAIPAGCPSSSKHHENSLGVQVLASPFFLQKGPDQDDSFKYRLFCDHHAFPRSDCLKDHPSQRESVKTVFRRS